MAPTTLTPRQTGHGMFSGTGFFTREGRPAMIYHGQGSGRNQIAFGLDDNLEQWSKPNMQKTDRKKNFDNLLKRENFQQGIQSLPREISLPKDGVLRLKPLRELEQLRQSRQQVKNLTVKSDTVRLLEDIQGDTMELEVVLTAPQAREFGVNLLCNDQGRNGFTIASGAGSKTLTVGYIDPPFELRSNEDLTLRIFIDKSMIEVFANDRQAAVAWHEYPPDHLQVSLFAKGGDLAVKQVTAWKLRTLYEGESVFHAN